MKIDLPEILKRLGLPAGLTLLFAALFNLFGLSLDEIIAVSGNLFGIALLIGLAIDVFKWAGILDEGWAGKVSAVLNLAVLVCIAVVFKLYPSFDFVSVDAQIAEFAKVFGILFAYIVQITSAKSFHNALVYGFGVKSFKLT